MTYPKTHMKKLILISLIAVTGCQQSERDEDRVTVIGNMKDVMWKGRLESKIFPDSIRVRKDLYGLGPMENLRGELLILDGVTFHSQVGEDSSLHVTRGNGSGAPFFSYSYVDQWEEWKLPDSIHTPKQMEKYLDKISPLDDPYFFKISGMMDEAMIHVVNLPEGHTVQSPADAHQGQISVSLKNRRVDVIGFFSRKHQAIFTHHDTYLHMHLITDDRKLMGHVDELVFSPRQLKFELPDSHWSLFEHFLTYEECL